MRNEKEIAQHYLQTKILGAYETADVIWQSDSEGESNSIGKKRSRKNMDEPNRYAGLIFCTDLTELTPEILHLFVEKVVVGEKAEKYSRTAPHAPHFSSVHNVSL